jgi:LEA14-like dessication related protein
MIELKHQWNEGGTMGRRILVSCLLVLVLAGCGVLARRAALKNCEYSLKSVELSDVTMSDMTLAVGVSARNSNDIEVVVDRMNYEFFINGKRAFEGSMGQGMKIAPGKTEVISSVMNLNYVELGTALAQAVKDDQANYDLRGTAYLSSSLGTFAYPFFVSK